MSYAITIKRKASNGGLTFTGGGKTITTTCYSNTSKKIPAATYLNYSTTTMTGKKNSKGLPREAIFIPDVKGFSGIFIHTGKMLYAKWSDGCIVIDESKMIQIYNTIKPKSGHNVQVIITG
ncbi:MAG: L,D-transpeptidase family protein, partial [Pseudomonadota bacterium]